MRLISNSAVDASLDVDWRVLLTLSRPVDRESYHAFVRAGAGEDLRPVDTDHTGELFGSQLRGGSTVTREPLLSRRMPQR